MRVWPGTLGAFNDQVHRKGPTCRDGLGAWSHLHSRNQKHDFVLTPSVSTQRSSLHSLFEGRNTPLTADFL